MMLTYSFRRYSSKKQYFIIWFLILIIYALYNEFLSYIFNTSKWSQIHCNYNQQCTKILLVADPQLIGNTQENFHFLTPLTIFDSDEYVRKTYRHAYNFVKPDIVVFLGDLMDEGSTATTSEFHGYVRRVFNIFLNDETYAEPKTKHIWVPGDNDIGGEGGDAVTKDKLKRFYRAFAQPELITYGNVTFFKINRLVQSIPIFKERREFYDTSKIFIGVSHLPLLFMPSIFVDKVLTKMLPHVLFAAHEHKAMIVRTDALLRQDRQIIPLNPDNNNNNQENEKIFEYILGSNDMYEFIIPTCSYRMGTEKIGYGFAVLEKNTIRFTVLWSPSRFKQLSGYFMLFLCFLLCSLFIVIRRKCKYCCYLLISIIVLILLLKTAHPTTVF